MQSFLRKNIAIAIGVDDSWYYIFTASCISGLLIKTRTFLQ